MKKIIATLLLLQAFSASAQLGVTTIKKITDPFPIDQWFTIRGRKQENKVYYQNENSIVDSLLNDLLKPWDLTIQDGRLDEDEELYWYLDNDNGYSATVYLIRRSVDSDRSLIIIIVTED